MESKKKNPNYVQQVFHKGLFNAANPPSTSHGSAILSPGDLPSCDTAGAKPPASSDSYSQDSTTTEIEDNFSHPSQSNPEWQRVPMMRSNKRRRTSTSPPVDVSPEMSNRFDGLPTDTPEPSESVKKTYKPPPFILYGIEDVNKLAETIEKKLNPTDYSFKIITKNQLRVNCVNTESYKILVSLIREKGLIGHTFTHKDEKCCRIVIKNLHHTTPHEEIIKEIAKSGNLVVGEVINARYGPDKKPTSTFFVNLEPGPNNKKAKEIKYIFHTAVIIEDPKKRQTVVQCTCCQQYGHTKNNCTRPFRCVKCALPHKTSDCPKKNRNSPAKCALCLGSHPANYKGCNVYQEIKKRKLEKTRNPFVAKANNKTETQSNETKEKATAGPRTFSRQSSTEKPLSYADMLKNQPQANPQHPSIEQLLYKQSEKIDLLL